MVAHLTGGEAPGDHQRLLQERRVDAEIATHGVQAEEVTVDAFADHRVAVQHLVLVARLSQQRHALLALNGATAYETRTYSIAMEKRTGEGKVRVMNEKSN